MKDKVEVIPATMEKFFGRSGKMVKPSIDSVKDLVQEVPLGWLLTPDELRDNLASNFDVDVACPAYTLKALKSISLEENPVCYWRVVKKNGALIPQFPNGVEGHARLLEKEGFEIDFSKKTPLLKNFKSRLHKLTYK